MHEALMFCGTQSGREVDKYKACHLNLAAAHQVESHVIETPGLFFECKIVFKSAMDPMYMDEAYEGLYPARDSHTLYFGEIVECYETE